MICILAYMFPGLSKVIVRFLTQTKKKKKKGKKETPESLGKLSGAACLALQHPIFGMSLRPTDGS